MRPTVPSLTRRAMGLACIATYLLMVAAPLRAQTCTATMGGLDFGTVDTVSGSPTDYSSSMSITCTGYATPNIRVCLSLGAPSGIWDPRHMTGPASNRLNYNLYQDASRTTVWTSVFDPQPRPVALDLPTNGGAASATVPYYGRVPGGQTNAPAGSYSNYFSTDDTLVQAGGYTGAPPACTTSSPPQTQRFSFTLLATVATYCTVSASNVDFGQQGFLNTPVNATGVITSTCTKGSNYTLSLNAGSGTGATFGQRRMTRSGGADTLVYALYRDSGRTQIWGDGSGGSSTVSGTGSGAAQTATVYAALPVQDTPAAGSYADTITVTVTF
ncbi:spore coat protein U domain-containing protein [Lysobacter soli]|uniref:Csu type fimbrial protein n=1 Tax=Lysobacter soli TaxID=453783 RepID=UPI0036BD0117